MKILHVSTANSWRGGEQQISFLMKELQHSAVSQMLLCPLGSPLEEFAKDNGFPVTGFTKKSGIDFNLATVTRRIVVKKGITLVHAHDSHAHTAAFISSYFTFKSFSIVVNRRVSFPLKSNWFSRLKYNHSCIKKIICVSKAVEEVVLKGVNHTRTAVLYSRIPNINKEFKDRDFLRKELGIANETKIVGHVGAFTKEKGHACFVDAAEILLKKNKGIHFVFAGKGILEEEIKGVVRDKGLQDYFSFLGFRKDIHAVMAGLDVLLFTSMSEGLGTAVLDALKEETPVVAFATGGLPEIIVPNETGILVKEYNDMAFANAIKLLLSDAELVSKIREGGKKHLDLFSIKTLKEDIIKIYISCA